MAGLARRSATSCSVSPVLTHSRQCLLLFNLILALIRMSNFVEKKRFKAVPTNRSMQREECADFERASFSAVFPLQRIVLSCCILSFTARRTFFCFLLYDGIFDVSVLKIQQMVNVSLVYNYSIDTQWILDIYFGTPTRRPLYILV